MRPHGIGHAAAATTATAQYFRRCRAVAILLVLLLELVLEQSTMVFHRFFLVMSLFWHGC